MRSYTLEVHTLQQATKFGAPDACEVLLHAAFQVLCDFIEGDERLVWQSHGVSALAWKGEPVPEEEQYNDYGRSWKDDYDNWTRLYELYRWWREQRPNRPESMDTEVADSEEDTAKLVEFARLRDMLWT